MKSIKKRGFHPGISCLPLAPDMVRKLSIHFSQSRGDFERRYFDGLLVDAFIECWQLGHQMELIPELRASIQDDSLTKCFFHLEPTMENLKHFLDSTVERPSFRWSENFRAASVLLREILCANVELTPINVNSPEECDKVWSNGRASAGFIGRGSKDDNRTLCYQAFRKQKELIAKGTPFSDIQIPCVMFHRSQISGFLSDEGKYQSGAKMKDRFIWGVDGATVTLEGQYAKPLIAHLIKHWSGYSGGDDPDTLRYKIAKANNGRSWLSLDFSKFDQTVQSWLIGEAFDIIKSFFDKKYHRELNFIAFNFVNTWVVTPGGEWVQKHRGIPSGSNFTQVVGSMCNALMILTYLCSKHSGSIKEKIRYVRAGLMDGGKAAMFVMGDDNLVFYRQKLDVVDMSSYVYRVFGVMIHPEKTISRDQSRYPHYLKRDWTGVGEYRDPLDLAIQVCHPERIRLYQGYGPWHIMYGLLLTYRRSFSPLCSEEYILEKMASDGGIPALLNLETHDLPGPLRAYGDKSREMLYSRAKAMLDYKAS